ncbi:MAG: thiamine-phosphate kinase [Nitrosopumilus sp.]|nr:thiamine-phosphate kinase [Nitrosopumilus sp.]MDA7957627.1 thiamine-phosphate kinase [Nitrosopumilus sp.]
MGPPEDAGSFRAGGQVLAACTDTLVLRTDAPPGMGPGEAGAKAVVACVSDLAAKGVRPEFGTISVSLPEGTTASYARRMAGGVGRACRRYGVRMVAGDTGEGEASVTICLVGRTSGMIPRGGARPGDDVYVTGPFGGAAAGLDSAMSGGSRFRRCVMAPAARLEFGVWNARYATAAMDSSDGLAATLHGIAGASGVRIDVDDVPAARGVAAYAGRRGLDLERLVFQGGEEYEIVFTAPGSAGRSIRAGASRMGVPVARIGAASRGSGVRLGGRPLADQGWRHLGRRRR